MNLAPPNKDMWKVLLPIAAVGLFAAVLYAAKRLVKEDSEAKEEYCVTCGCQRTAAKCLQCGQSDADPTLRDPGTMY